MDSTSHLDPTNDIGLSLFPGENVLMTLRTWHLRLILTSDRLIQYGEARRLLFIPGGLRLDSALLEDVDAVTIGKKYLSFWLAVIGAGAILFAIFARSQNGTAFLAFLIGVGFLLVWYFVNVTVLEFKVSGNAHFSFQAIGYSNPLAELRPFVDAYYRLKAERGRR